MLQQTPIIPNYLALTALGEERPGLINSFTQNIIDCGCNILNSKVISLGTEIALSFLVCGNWGEIAKMEAVLPNLEKKLSLTILQKRTSKPKIINNTISYAVYAVTFDKPGLLNELTNFFIEQGINIESAAGYTYSTNNNIVMMNLNITVNISIDTHIPSLREEFLVFCDGFNLDASFEPVNS